MAAHWATMDPKLHLRIVAYFIEANATYSDIQQAHTISVAHLMAVYNRIVLAEALETSQHLSLLDALEHGVSDGLWIITYDEDTDTEMVVLKPTA
jgi:hypothetical protein